MSRTVADFEDFIALDVPDAPSIVMQHVLREGIIRFMRESQIFQDDLTFEGQCGVSDYYLELPACQQLVTVESVVPAPTCPGARYPLTAVLDASGRKGWGWERDGMHPVILFNMPLRDKARFEVRYAWAISRDDCDVPDELYEQWMEAVKAAALAQLYRMPKQEWFNPQMAADAEHTYSVELRKAKNRRWSGYARGPMMTVSRPFVGCR